MNTFIKPKFLKNVKVTKTDQIKLKPFMSNWLILSKSIRNLNETQLKKMIIIEYESSRRMQIIQRLKSRFNSLRNTRENFELTSLRNN